MVLSREQRQRYFNILEKYQQFRTLSRELYGNQLSLYFCELPRFVKEGGKELTPVEQWFEILKNMSNFVERPANIDRRFDSIFEACRQNRLDITEKEQYFSAMISEHEKQGIAAAYKEEGLREGFEKGLEKGRAESARNMLMDGVPIEKIVQYTGLSEAVIQALH